MRFSQWEDKSVFQSFLCHMICHNQLELGIWVRYIHTDIIQRDKRQYEAPHSVGVWSLKIQRYRVYLLNDSLKMVLYEVDPKGLVAGEHLLKKLTQGLSQLCLIGSQLNLT